MDNKPAQGELWKARQLKEYRRANGLCYSCGDKFLPGHICPAAAQQAQVKAAEMADIHEIISDAVFDALVTEDGECAKISVQALAGSTSPKTI